MWIFALQEYTVMVDLWHHCHSFHIPIPLHYCLCSLQPFYPLRVIYWLYTGQEGRESLWGFYLLCFRELICYLLVERWCAYPFALSEAKCKFVCSRSLKSERAISSCALLSQRVFCNFAPLLPACLLSWHGRVRALQAARSFSCILLGCHKTRWAPFNPISEIHSDVGMRGKKRKKSHFYFAPCPSSANFTGNKRVAPINDHGPEAAPALAQEQHGSSVGWHHARPASLPTLKQMKWD